MREVSKFLGDRVNEEELPDDIMVKHEKEVSEFLQARAPPSHIVTLMTLEIPWKSILLLRRFPRIVVIQTTDTEDPTVTKFPSFCRYSTVRTFSHLLSLLHPV